MLEGLNVVAPFNGMNCAYIALIEAGFKINKYFAIEIDKYANKVSEAIDSNIIQLGDI